MSKHKHTVVRRAFPQVYSYVHPKNGMKYWIGSARSEKWGMNERPHFNSEKDALEWARQIAEKIEKNGAVRQLPKEKEAAADAYEKLARQLTRYQKTPEDAVTHYLKFLGDQTIRQAKPLLKKLVDDWEAGKLGDKLHPLSKKTRNEVKSYARFIRRKWGKVCADEVTRKMVEDALKELKVANNTRKKYLTYISMVFKWLRDHKHIAENPTEGIKIKYTPFEAEFYPPDTTKAVLHYVLKNEPDLMGFYALLTFAGFRISNVARRMGRPRRVQVCGLEQRHAEGTQTRIQITVRRSVPKGLNTISYPRHEIFPS